MLIDPLCSAVCQSGYFLAPHAVPAHPVWGSVKRASTTSFGSIAFGSFIVAFIRTVRFFVNLAYQVCGASKAAPTTTRAVRAASVVCVFGVAHNHPCRSVLSVLVLVECSQQQQSVRGLCSVLLGVLDRHPGEHRQLRQPVSRNTALRRTARANENRCALPGTLHRAAMQAAVFCALREVPWNRIFVSRSFRLLRMPCAHFHRYAFAICAIYGKPFLASAQQAWGLMKSRGFDAVINDSLIGGVLQFAQIICGLFTGVIAALVAYYGFSSDWRPWAGVGFVVGVMLMVVITEVVESAVVALFICLADDPVRLQQTKPDAYNRIMDPLNANYPVRGGARAVPSNSDV